MKKWLIWLIVLALAITLYCLVYFLPLSYPYFFPGEEIELHFIIKTTLLVPEGETVERGQLLFETVEGKLDGLQAQGSAITTPVSGTVASIQVAAGQKVSKGDTVLTLYPQGSYVVEFDVPESALMNISEGQQVQVYFEQQDEPLALSGKVLSVDYVAQENKQEAVYTAIASLEENENIRLGMTATVMVAE